MALRDIFSPRIRLIAQDREISALKKEVAALKAQNESMRVGMRRCLTCDYRLAVRGEAKADQSDLLTRGTDSGHKSGE